MSRGDPFEVMAAVFATLDLMSAATEAVDHARELGLPRPAQVAAIVANVGFVDAGERAPDGARLDLLTTGTQAAVEAGVSAEDLESNSTAAWLPDLTLGEPGCCTKGIGLSRRTDAPRSSLAQRCGFCDYVQGLLLPGDRNKMLTGLASRHASSPHRADITASIRDHDRSDKRLHSVLPDPNRVPVQVARQAANRAADRERAARHAQQQHQAHRGANPELVAEYQAVVREDKWRTRAEARAVELLQPGWSRELGQRLATVKGVARDRAHALLQRHHTRARHPPRPRARARAGATRQGRLVCAAARVAACHPGGWSPPRPGRRPDRAKRPPGADRSQRPARRPPATRPPRPRTQPRPRARHVVGCRATTRTTTLATIAPAF